jgi:hypothetical protein
MLFCRCSEVSFDGKTIRRVTLAKALDGLVEIDPDRLADQRRPAGAVDITQLGHCFPYPNSGLHQQQTIAL